MAKAIVAKHTIESAFRDFTDAQCTFWSVKGVVDLICQNDAADQVDDHIVFALRDLLAKADAEFERVEIALNHLSVKELDHRADGGA